MSHSTTNRVMYCPFRPVSCAHELVHKSTCNARILDKSLEATRFLKKKITLLHRYKPQEAQFCAARFFSGTKNRVSRGLAV